MNSLLYHLIPMILSLGLSEFIYMKIDKKYEFTVKLSANIPVKHKWKPLFCFIVTVISGLTIGILGIYVIDIPDIFYYILSGIIIGCGISISTKMQTI